MPFVILGLGSNLGDRLAYLKAAISALKDKSILYDIHLSSVYESDAQLPEGAPDTWNISFVNMAAGGTTNLSAQQLLSEIKEIEKSIGRTKTADWAPREIDIDILAYGNEQITEEGLTIPHKRLMERPFALLPLLDIAPDWKSPAGISAKKAAENFPRPLPFDTKNIGPLV